jgi:glycosyltransferase involved in cell wall biosynthesis
LKLRGLLREIQPDIVHTNGFKVHLLGVRVAPARVPVIWHLRDYVGARPATKRLMKSQARKCAAVIANSQSVADDARGVWGDTPSVHVVLNRIDLERFSPAGPTLNLDALAGLPRASDGVVRVGLPATFARWKGHEILLDAFSQLPASANLRGYIIGGPLYETEGSQYTSAELRALVQRHGLDQRVGLTGYVDDSAAAMRALDIVVHASTHPEPFGRTIVEAMGCGRAVVTSAIGGAREVIEDGADALSFESGNAADLARVLERLARDPTLREQLGQRARETAIRRFDRREIAAEIIPIYQSVKPLQNP